MEFVKLNEGNSLSTDNSNDTCPICGSKTQKGATQCTKCGFTKIQEVFINKEEYNHWMEYTVEPCRAMYNKLHNSQKDVSVKKYENLKNSYQELAKKYNDLLRELAENTDKSIIDVNVSTGTDISPGYGDIVKHKVFGEGKIISHNYPMNYQKLLGKGTSESITVSFEKRFIMPDAFEKGYLSLIDKKK